MGMASMSTLSAPALAQSASAADGEEEILVTGNRLVSEREREVLGYTLRGYSASRTAAPPRYFAGHREESPQEHS